MFVDFVKFIELPKATKYWTRKAPFPLRTFGNTSAGCCTRAAQAQAVLRMERIEQRRLINITDDEVLRVYVDMSNRLYGGGDNGAYMEDALNEWRRPETTFRDTDGKPYTIDAYLRINPFNHEEVKAGLALSGAKGIYVALNLPAAWQSVEPPAAWDIPEGQPAIGPWLPGSWGGHALWARDFDAQGIWLVQTWNLADTLLTWRAAATYMDEAFVVIDSINSWKRKPRGAVRLNLKAVVAAVNDVSDMKIAA
jgi:hypothetical protein